MRRTSDEQRQAGSDPAADAPHSEGRVDDLQVYTKLISTSEDLRNLSRRCWSLCSSQCLSASHLFIRKLASILHDRTFL